MRLYENEAKRLFAREGIAVPRAFGACEKAEDVGQAVGERVAVMLVGLVFDGTFDTVASDYVYDTVRTRELSAGLNTALFDTQGHTPLRASLMFDYSRSEFSRLRLQLTHDRSQPDAGSEVLVQYIMSLGAHGAHAF